MMASSASMISSRLTRLLVKLSFRLNALVGGLIREDVVLRAAGLRLGRRLAQLLARGAALAGDLLDQGGHFLRRLLPNYLQKQRLRGNVGQPTKIPDLLGHLVQRQRLGDRGARLAQPPRQVLVRVAAALGQAVQRLGLFERRQVLALQVLDQRELDDLGVVDVADDDRQLAQAGLDRRLVAALAGDDLEALAALAGRRAAR